MRKLFAVILLLFGMLILALDVHTSWKQQGPLHYLNIAVAMGARVYRWVAPQPNGSRVDHGRHPPSLAVRVAGWQARK